MAAVVSHFLACGSSYENILNVGKGLCFFFWFEVCFFFFLLPINFTFICTVSMPTGTKISLWNYRNVVRNSCISKGLVINKQNFRRKEEWRSSWTKGLKHKTQVYIFICNSDWQGGHLNQDLWRIIYISLFLLLQVIKLHPNSQIQIITFFQTDTSSELGIYCRG